MGLDQWLLKRQDKEVAYFRKVNFLQRFIVEYVGMDNEGQECILHMEHIEELLSRCNYVIQILENAETITEEVEIGMAFKDGERIPQYGKQVVFNDEAAKEVSELLPTQEGFFFGSTVIGEGYLEDVRDVKKVCEDILKNFDFEDALLVYHCWW